jgi:hypothetical protein
MRTKVDFKYMDKQGYAVLVFKFDRATFTVTTALCKGSTHCIPALPCRAGPPVEKFPAGRAGPPVEIFVVQAWLLSKGLDRIAAVDL